MGNRSEIAQIRTQIDLELDALETFLHGYAVVARHEVIAHHFQQLNGYTDNLAKFVGESAAIEEICEKYNTLK